MLMQYVANTSETARDEEQRGTLTVHRLVRPDGRAYAHASAARIPNRKEFPDWDSVLQHARLNLLGVCRHCWKNAEWGDKREQLLAQLPSPAGGTGTLKS